MERGDHLVSPRTGYTHHGIYVGNGRVIHYGGLADGYSKEWIGETSLAGFAAGNEVSVVSHSLRVYDHDETVERAYSRLYEDEYNLVFNNCEHFAMWCIYGVKFSVQVNMVKGAIGVTWQLYDQYARRTLIADGLIGISETLGGTATVATTKSVGTALVSGALASGIASGGITSGTMAGIATGTTALATTVAAAPALPLLVAAGAAVALWSWLSD